MNELPGPALNYLARLRHAARALPRASQDELVADIEAHFRDAVTKHDDIEAVIVRLGTPEAVAQAASEPVSQPPRTTRLRRLGIVGLLLAGGIVLPVVGWIAGVWLLWRSTLWSHRDKLIGTLVLPGGLLIGWILFFRSDPDRGTFCITKMSNQGVPVVQCTGGPSTTHQIVSVLLIAVALLAPILSAAWLLFVSRGKSQEFTGVLEL